MRSTMGAAVRVLLAAFACASLAASALSTNGALWKDGKPVSLRGMHQIDAPAALVYQPGSDWTFSHHPFITVFEGVAYAMWSNGKRDEDAPGQRVLISRSTDFAHWEAPVVLMEPRTGAHGLNVLTAAGFHQHKGTLVAYVGSYGPDKQDPELFALRTRDGKKWTAPATTGLRVVPSRSPIESRSGRLIMAGNIAFPWTRDPAGVSGWRMAGIYGEAAGTTTDDPVSFRKVSRARGWGAELCEGSLIVGDDGVLKMALRDASEKGGALWVSESRDDGVTWSEPKRTEFSDTNAKFEFGKLPDGRFFYVGNPIGSGRFPLVLSLSNDGDRFDRHFVIGSKPYRMRTPGKAKGGDYGYPDAIVAGGMLRVIVSRQKEAIEVISVPLSKLGS